MMHRAAARAAIISQLALLVLSCTPMGNSTPAANSTSTGATTLTAEQRAGGCRSRFDRTCTAAWRGYKQATMPAGWQVVYGVLTKTGSVNAIITKDQI